MDEHSALRVVAVRAVETAENARDLWGDEDRAWASRAAAEVVGAGASPDTFLARRAMLAIEKLGAQHPAFPRAVNALRWRGWVGSLIVALAFAFGFFLDQVDRAQRVNILAPPVLGLLIWNAVVYIIIVAGYVVRYGDGSKPGPLRGAVARFASGSWRPRRSGAIRESVVRFVDDWAHRSASLYGMRAARILHMAAAALALGVIAGLYVRGIAFEYRANWESTFLEAPAVRTIVALLYAPGAFLTGIPLPAADAVAAIRSPAGENAARWLHLIAATLVMIVIVPRLLLALMTGLVERYRAQHLPLPLDEPYFQRLLRGYRGGSARVRVIPFSYTPAPAAIAGLEAIIARSFGGTAAIVVTAPVGYDADDLFPTVASASGWTVVALFSAAATPEREVHGAFLAALIERFADAESLLAIVDEGPWTARWKNDGARIADRRASWRELGDTAHVPMVFVDLSAPDLVAAAGAVDDAIASGAGGNSDGRRARQGWQLSWQQRWQQRWQKRG